MTSRRALETALAAILAAGCALAVVRASAGEVVACITSPDGMWSAGIDSLGQLVELVPPGEASEDHVFQSIIYVASTEENMLTERLEYFWKVNNRQIGPHEVYTALTRPGSAIEVQIEVTMLDGPSGGARIEIALVNSGGLPLRAQPFLYADLDIAATSRDDEALAIFSPRTGALLAIQQVDGETAGVPLWYGGQGSYAGYQIGRFQGLRLDLDLGLKDLSDTDETELGDLNDHALALSGEGALLLLQPGESTSLVVGVGGVGIGTDLCPWDCAATPDGAVGTADLLALLTQWAGGGMCDFDGGGTGTSDLLALLANWGACP